MSTILIISDSTFIFGSTDTMTWIDVELWRVLDLFYE